MSSDSHCDNVQVTDHDNAVLNRIFNPNLPYGDVVDEGSENETENSSKPSGSEECEDSPEWAEAKKLEVEGVNAAESGDMQLALNLFSSAIHAAPNRASGYNNRAQTLRLKGDVQGAFQDLNTAIEISEGRGNAACQAYTQRGLIYRLEGNDEDALNDFKCAAKLGGKFAQQQVVAMNPYAALCNQMMSEMFRKVKAGESC